MPTDQRLVQELVENPRESLSHELKGWLDPSRPEDQALLVKTLLALHNQNGGFLLVGFQNSGAPDAAASPPNVETRYASDVIQELVSKHAAPPISVHVHMGRRGDLSFPVLEVESGVRTPVVAKRAIQGAAGDELLVKDGVYVRSLRANGRVSTTLIQPNDWPELVERCFENREADIGRFLRRHLGGVSPDAIRELSRSLSKGLAPAAAERAQALLEDGSRRYEARTSASELPPFSRNGRWEVAVVIDGVVPPHSANRDFLNLLMSSQPSLTGWPVWLDSTRFPDPSPPNVLHGAWEALIIAIGEGIRDHLDFWRIWPDGRFYSLRALKEESFAEARNNERGKWLFFDVATIWVAESMAVALAFAKAMGCEPETTKLEVVFRWQGLHGRRLVSSPWSNRGPMSAGTASQNVIEVSATVPLDVAPSALSQYVQQVTKELFNLFGGYAVDPSITEDITSKLLTRRL